MKKENSLHVRFRYGEAVSSKKSILTSQMILLRIAKYMEGYRVEREKELWLKSELYKKIRELRANITRLKRDFPEPEMPNSLRKNIEEKEYKTKKKKYDKSLEEQLQDIQKRIEELQKKSH